MQASTVRGCTRNFLSGLQENFPSTVPTVFRTGDKLLPYSADIRSSRKNSISSNAPITTTLVSPSTNIATSNVDGQSVIASNTDCHLCKAPLDTDQPTASALEATKLSGRLSTLAIGKDGTEHNDVASIGSIGSGQQKDEGDSKNEEDLDYESHITQEDLIRLLCYGCRIVVHKMVSCDQLLLRNFYSYFISTLFYKLI